MSIDNDNGIRPKISSEEFRRFLFEGGGMDSLNRFPIDIQSDGVEAQSLEQTNEAPLAPAHTDTNN